MSGDRLGSIEIDPATLPAANADIERERRVAAADLIDRNVFQPAGGAGGPYALKLSSQDGRLVFDVSAAGFQRTHGLSMSPLKRTIRDYIAICDSYQDVLRGADAAKIEAVDMGRRGLHNEGADLLRARLDGKATIDHETARRLFTLVTTLYRR